MSQTKQVSKTGKATPNTNPAFNPGVVASNGEKPRTRREERLALLVSQLGELRGSVDQLAEQYRLRVGGQIADFVEVLSAKGRPNGKKPTMKVIELFLDELAEQSIKPKKGRAKDFVKVQRLMRRLANALPAD